MDAGNSRRRAAIARLSSFPAALACATALSRPIVAAAIVAIALPGCGEKTGAPAPSAADIRAGAAIAQRDCKNCHGMDGKGMAPAIPHMAAQRARYLYNSLKEYQTGKRTHAAVKQLVADMSATDLHNVSAYYASLPPLPGTPAPAAKQTTPYEKGKLLAAPCARCHGEDGNSKTPGTPTLAGQQPYYLLEAMQEYHRGGRAKDQMRSDLLDADKAELESLVMYFVAQTPLKRGPALRGDAAAGERASAVCSGCHGRLGVSVDATTPSLAGQDPEYLAKAIKSYRTTRRNWGMQRYVASLNDKDIDNVVAYYAAQTPRAAELVPPSAQDLAVKCDQCHEKDATDAAVAPKLKGQDKDYLVMALRAYRDDKRESSTMHRMSFPYSNAIIDSLASWYASQPAN